jgi:alkylation response protein AidB-like acyl-CoA dehydrogenase
VSSVEALLAESGWGFPTWPAEWFGRGLSADGLGQLLGGPMLLVHGSEEQQARFLPALARGEESWCQFSSEPGAVRPGRRANPGGTQRSPR